TADDDNITSDRTPTFTITNYKAVTDADNVSVKWFVDGVEQAGETGATFTTSELPDGTYVVTARFIDVSGNMSESNAIKVVINTTSQNANGSDMATQIFGSWQLIEFYSFSGLATGDEESNWSKVENGYILELKPDGRFFSSEFEECQAGTFTITSDESDDYVTLKYGCEGFVPRHNHNKDYDKDILSYSYVITDSIMELKPVSYTCYEGCNVRLTKIK
ncbi:MAG: hypothetical protein GDA42_11900, partial [Ekhidna sp.]|nr:hypothetical protein [Ekhidna sp.]